MSTSRVVNMLTKNNESTAKRIQDQWVKLENIIRNYFYPSDKPRFGFSGGLFADSRLFEIYLDNLSFKDLARVAALNKTNRSHFNRQFPEFKACVKALDNQYHLACADKEFAVLVSPMSLFGMIVKGILLAITMYSLLILCKEGASPRNSSMFMMASLLFIAALKFADYNFFEYIQKVQANNAADNTRVTHLYKVSSKKLDFLEHFRLDFSTPDKKYQSMKAIKENLCTDVLFKF